MKRKYLLPSIAFAVAMLYGQAVLADYIYYGVSGGPGVFTTLTITDDATFGADLDVTGYITAGSTIDGEGKGMFGSSAAEADFPNVQFIISQVDSGSTNSTLYRGLVVEAERYAIVGIGLGTTTSGNVGVYAIGVAYGTTQSTESIGVQAQSTSTHASGTNTAIKCNAANGSSNYCVYGVAGIIYNAGDLDIDGDADIAQTLYSNSIIIRDDDGIILERAASGDAVTDVTLAQVYDGSTAIAASKIIYDSSAGEWEFANKVYAVTLGGSIANLSTRVAAQHYTSVAGDVEFGLPQQADDFSWQNKHDVEVAHMQSNGNFILDGDSAGAASIKLYDGATVYMSQSLDGATVRFGSSTGDFEFDPADGAAVVFTGATITINGENITSITGAEIETTTHHRGQNGAGYFDFTGVCADTETATIDGKVFEFDAGVYPDCTGGEDYCVDVSGGVAAAQCATALVSSINTAAINFSADLETDIAIVVGHTAGDNLSLAETGANITVSAAAFTGDEPPLQHILYHFVHTVNAADAAAVLGANGALTLGAIESNVVPILSSWHVFDSVGKVVSITNTSLVVENTAGNHYAVIIRDASVPGEIDAGDVITALFLAHE
jgi:hypothetical protein